MANLVVVDDDAAVADVVALALRSAGHTTSIAYSTTEAAEALQQESIDGVIIDVWLDGDDGLNLAQQVSTRTPPLPFIVMSGGGKGKTLENVTARADALGAVRVLFKPFDDDELLDAVNEMLN